MASILGAISNFGVGLKNRAQGVLDSVFPPEKRAEVIARLQAFVLTNPKLSAFLLANIALTGIPLLLFAVFSLTVFIFSLLAALLVAVLAALLFTAFMVGVALLVLLPTVFMTTFSASFIFLWGLGGYYILKWFNEGESPAEPGSAIGDKINSLTGGKLDFLMDATRKREEMNNETNNQTDDDDDTVSEDPVGVKSNIGKATKTANLDGVKKRAGGATAPAQSVAGTAKGTVGGAAGL